MNTGIGSPGGRDSHWMIGNPGECLLQCLLDGFIVELRLIPAERGAVVFDA